MNNFKYEIVNGTLCIYLESDTEFGSFLGDKVSGFIKSIGYKGEQVKVFKSGILISILSVSMLGGCASNSTYDTIENDGNNVINNISDEKSEIVKPKMIEIEIKQNLINLNSNKVGGTIKPKYIVIHNTANNAPAKNEVAYLKSASNTSSTSFHIAVDESEIIQAIPFNMVAYHAGNPFYNNNSIGIEIARSTSTDITIRDKAIQNAQKLIRYLMDEFNIELSNVITHKDSSGKHCPHDIFDRYGIERFYNELKEITN